jgi:hypothetical protein
MAGMKRGLTLVSILLAWMTGCRVAAVAQAPLAVTTVQDTVYTASGTPASGTMLVGWAAFTTASGAAIPAGATSATIGAGGALSLTLAPNAGATPIGSYYTVTFHLSDGSTSRQFWVIPVTVPGGGPVKLAAIQNDVMPTSVAMQTVSKAYVDHAIAAAVTGTPADTSSPYVLKTGDTMTGPLVLPADPVSPNQAADKNYVDENVTGIASGLGQKVSLLPSTTQVVTQPSGTQLDVNLLNGELYASQYETSGGTNGIANAFASPDCANGCQVKVEPTYGGSDVANYSNMPTNGTVIDQRGGSEIRTTLNPMAKGAENSVSTSVLQVETMSAQQLQALRPGAVGVGADAVTLSTIAPTGGSNLFPQNIETPPYFKSTYGVLQLNGVYNTQGQHVQFGNVVSCYGVGDCLAGGQFITSSGGYRDNADEGAHPFDLQVSEDSRVFEGTCASGCTTGSTSLNVTATLNAGTQGDGRYLINRNPAKTITTGQIVGGAFPIPGAYLPFGQANFTGTSFPVSVFMATAQAATSQPLNMAPGTVTLPIQASGVPTGYVTNTAALPSTSGVACVADGGGGASDTPNYEMATYSVVDGTHITLNLNKVHELGATIAVGGLCGYGIEQTIDTKNGIRQLYPVMGSLSATSLYYAESGMAFIGSHAAGSTSAYLNMSFPVASIARTGNVTTVTTAGNPIYDLNGLSMTVSGVADSSYNGSFQVSMTGPNTFTYPNSGADSTSSGGMIGYLTGSYVLYPMAEVLSVYDPANKQVDGAFTLGANTAAWAAGDAVEEPHYYKQLTYGDTEFITQYVPRPAQFVASGKTYLGLMGVGARGWQVNNATPVTEYFGAGGSYNVPDDAYTVVGPWANDFEVDAGANAVTRVHCNLYTCNRWDSTYKLFDLDSIGGEDYLYYSPQASTATWQLRGQTFAFGPQGFSAATINVGTLNATTIMGGVSGAAINSGTIDPARLPVFGPSGTTHADGVVPDPGSTAGDTRYLREDGTWSVPAGGAGIAATGSANLFVAGGNSSNTGSFNTSTGINALSALTSGTENTAFGYQSLNLITSGNENSALGKFSLQNLTTGQNNNAFGWDSQRANVSGEDNNAFGNASLSVNVSGSGNTAFGDGTLQLTTSSANTAVGANALPFNTTGTDNIAVGYFAMSANTTASYSTAVGWEALGNETTNGSSTAVGYGALQNTNGGNNTALGVNALATLTGGNNNIGIGNSVGPTCVYCVFDTLVGNGSDVNNNAASYRSVIGAGATGTVDNSVTLGRSADVVIVPSLTAAGCVTNTAGGQLGTAACFIRLSGTTGSIGGSSLTAGACSTGSVTLTGAVAGHTVAVSAADGTLPNALTVISAAVTSVNTVTVQVCAIAAVTPSAKAYNVTTY